MEFAVSSIESSPSRAGRLPALPHPAGRRGLNTVELLVALTLLTTALTVGTQVVVRAKGVLDDHRDYRIALDEASNLLDTLTVASPDALDARLEALQPSPTLSKHLNNPTLSGGSERDSLGARITLRLTWGPVGQAPKAIVLSGWHIEPPQTPASQSDEEGETP